MVPSRRSMPRRNHGSMTAVAVILILTGCSSGSDAEPQSADSAESTATTSGNGSGADGAVRCEAAPALPSDIPTFRSEQAPEAVAPEEQKVRIRTNCGDISLALNGAAAPQTVASFILLGNGGYWTDSPCHRLVDGGIFVLQCGDPTGTGRGDPGYTFGIENAPPDGVYPRGTVAMARTQDPESNGGQFFLVFKETALPVEGGGYTIFGTVTNGMNIVDHVAELGVDGGGNEGSPAQPISIVGIDIEEEGTTS